MIAIHDTEQEKDQPKELEAIASAEALPADEPCLPRPENDAPVPSHDGVTATAEGPLPAAGTPISEAALGRIEELNAKVDRLLASFEEKLRYDAGREAVIDRLHAELQECKADLVLKISKPLALEMIQIYDDLGAAVEAYRQSTGAPWGPEKLLMLLGNLKTNVEDGLYRHGFEQFTCEQAEFDPRRQRVRKPVPTNDPDQDKMVEGRLRKGFVYEGKVIVRPEIVNVFVFQRAEQS